MFRLEHEDDLLEAFRPRDRKHVELPPGRRYPFTCLDYFAWASEHGERIFLLFKAPSEQLVTGITFRRDNASSSDPTPRVCHWCLAFGSARTIGMLSADVNSKRKVGVYVCLDLGCRERVEEDANRRGKPVREAVAVLLEKMAKFSREALGITQQNRNVSLSP